MDIILNQQHYDQLRLMAAKCGTSPEYLAKLFVEDGIRSYSSPGELDELRDSIGGKQQP